MASNVNHDRRRRPNPWRIAGWAIAALLLLAPLVAMQLSDEMNWSAFDFAFAGTLIVGVGILLELAARKSGSIAYRAAIGVALLAASLLIVINGAVGIVGSEANPANLAFGAVLAVGVIGAIIARFRPEGMARAMVAAAITQAAIFLLLAGSGLAAPIRSPEIPILTVVFCALWLGSAWLFRMAARRAAA